MVSLSLAHYRRTRHPRSDRDQTFALLVKRNEQVYSILFYYRIFFEPYWFCFVFILFIFKVQNVGAEKDAISFLRAPTHYGKPNWKRSPFPSIVEKHPETDAGVVSLVLFYLLG